MTADQLRQAAQKIRDMATAAATVNEGDWYAADDLTTFGEAAGEDAAHIALWSPPVARAVADWLDRTAEESGDFLNLDHPAMRLTDLILGGAS